MNSKQNSTTLKPVSKGNARILFIALFCLVFGAVGSFVTMRASQKETTVAVDQAQVAAENAQSQAKTVQDILCANQADKETEVCIQAQNVIDDPKTPAPPIKGDTGAPGLGIVSSIVNSSGELILTYTDGKTKNLGLIKGAPGPTGPPGAPGANGISITEQSVNAAGRLIVTYSDGRTVDVGYVIGSPGEPGLPGVNGLNGLDGAPGETGAQGEVGPKGDIGLKGDKGDKGDTGDPGRGIAGISCSGAGASSFWIITFSDSTVTEVTGPCRVEISPIAPQPDPAPNPVPEQPAPVEPVVPNP